MKLKRDNLWIWGQHPGCHHAGGYKLPGENRMDSAEGARYLGIPNCCRVVMQDKPAPPFDAESEKLKGFKQVVWSSVGAGSTTRHRTNQSDLEEVLRQAGKYDNVTGAVLDDFFPSAEDFETNTGDRARHTIDSIRSMRDRLHGFPGRKLDLWLVWYDYQLDFNVEDYVDLCDVITFWTWEGSQLSKLDENIEKFVRKTPGKRRLAGCYMWNYGETKPLSNEQMQNQLDRYQYWIEKGDLEGIVFCSNCIADIGLEAVELTRQWISKIPE
jgi:hypothetical protein